MRNLLFIFAFFFNGFLTATALAQNTTATATGSGSFSNYFTKTTSTQSSLAWIIGIILLGIVFYAFYKGNTPSKIISRKSSKKDREHLNS
ncbi:hypothetical protein [Pedobacter flavus]|uniref:CcmD family protein n=1 Tax=Pedobacter flavus TaxID=3113906 RepID=A0ABU7H1I1_9SPHI|nr:hypothetical protein [Pedobacter sp. VNH31]MEE1885078.1 hypothetical protein [Pedobacter sp. VNH31]